ncbi:DUF4124 domain-containing protein [Pseudoduganella sp. UC29_71]|jgi:hypothetical protein|uniref:DUF4124 domain-containing protein n=1 Tax=Pseudoduganella sp. UC29_71 TaxID=3350174 RepID=UPI000D302C23
MTTWNFAPLVLLLASGLVSSAASAQGQIFLCVDASGHKELTDSRKHASCKPLDIPGAIPAPARRAENARPRAAAPAAAPAATPGDFPRVDSSEQKARDADRRQILMDELNGEQAKLNELRKEFNNGEPERRGDERNYAKYQERVASLKDSISRSEKNVEALKREIQNIR